MPDLPQGTVTFVFTDIEESTELLKRLGDEYHEVLVTHRRLVRDLFGASDGVEIDTQGDAFFFAFPRARDAVEAAVEAQRAHAGADWPREETVRVRMGLHTGEPALHEEGYVGLDVVRAARICTEGHGGQILLSETTRALLGAGLPEGVSVFPLGQRHLRGIDEPERVYEISIDDLEHEELPAPPEPPAVPPESPAEVREREYEERLESYGERLSASIQERVLRSLEAKLGKEEARADADMDEDESAVDDIAARMEALGSQIDARIQAALAKRGRGPRDDS
jgi:class 3 adenylate cyclase